MSVARETKDKLYTQFALIGHALASPKRLELLDLLCQSEKTVETLAKQSSMSIANTSQHLQVLRASRLVDSSKRGVFVYYRLADSKVCDFFRELRALAEDRIAEIDRVVADYFDASSSLEPVDKRKLIRRAKAGEVVILDVRPEDEYLAGHLPHAKSVPLPELEERLKELPSGAEIVAYCRGPYCVLSQEAVKLLSAKGFKIRRMADGVAEWREAGLKVAVGKR